MSMRVLAIVGFLAIAILVIIGVVLVIAFFTETFMVSYGALFGIILTTLIVGFVSGRIWGLFADKKESSLKDRG